MKWVVATAMGLLVLLLMWPVVCAQGEGDPGHCTSVLSVRVLGSANSGDTWGLLSIPAAAAVFWLVLKLSRLRDRGE